MLPSQRLMDGSKPPYRSEDGGLATKALPSQYSFRPGAPTPAYTTLTARGPDSTSSLPGAPGITESFPASGLAAKTAPRSSAAMPAPAPTSAALLADAILGRAQSDTFVDAKAATVGYPPTRTTRSLQPTQTVIVIPQPKNKRKQTALFASIAALSVLLFLMLIGLAFWSWRRRRKAKHSHRPHVAGGESLGDLARHGHQPSHVSSKNATRKDRLGGEVDWRKKISSPLDLNLNLNLPPTAYPAPKPTASASATSSSSKANAPAPASPSPSPQPQHPALRSGARALSPPLRLAAQPPARKTALAQFRNERSGAANDPSDPPPSRQPPHRNTQTAPVPAPTRPFPRTNNALLPPTARAADRLAKPAAPKGTTATPSSNSNSNSHSSSKRGPAQHRHHHQHQHQHQHQQRRIFAPYTGFSSDAPSEAGSSYVPDSRKVNEAQQRRYVRLRRQGRTNSEVWMMSSEGGEGRHGEKGGGGRGGSRD